MPKDNYHRSHHREDLKPHNFIVLQIELVHRYRETNTLKVGSQQSDLRNSGRNFSQLTPLQNRYKNVSYEFPLNYMNNFVTARVQFLCELCLWDLHGLAAKGG
jgi:hypothetical protein